MILTRRYSQQIFLYTVYYCFREALREEWDDHKSIKYNMESMGISYDPNNAVSKGHGNVSG